MINFSSTTLDECSLYSVFCSCNSLYKKFEDGIILESPFEVPDAVDDVFAQKDLKYGSRLA